VTERPLPAPGAARPMTLPAGLAALAAAAFLLAGATLFFGAGTSGGRLLWLGGGAWALLAVWGAAAAAGRVPAPRPGRPGIVVLACLLGLALWMGVSIAWSDAPDRSWDALNRGLAYTALAGVGLCVGAAARRRPAVVGGSLALLVGAALGWALLGKVFPGLFPDGARAARLRSPIGYWNALALVACMAVPLGAWLGTGAEAGAGAVSAARARAARLAGVLLLFVAGVAVILTTSRGGLAVAALAAVVWLALDERRLESLVALACGLLPAGAVGGWALTQPGLADDGQSAAARSGAGGWLALALVLGAAATAGLALAWERREARAPLAEGRRRALGRAGLAVVVVALAAAAVAVGVRGGWQQDEQVTQGASRLGTANTNNRWTWWQEAWQVFTAQPAEGAGAGAFVVARTPVRDNALDVVEPHNLPLQLLAETGVFGFLLLAGVVVAAALAGRRAVGRAGPDRRVVLALALVPGCFLVHALVDISWDFAAVAAPALLALGAVLALERGTGGGGAPALHAQPRPRPRRAAAAATALPLVALACAAIASLAVPWGAARTVDEAYAALDRGDIAGAARLARDARGLDPFSLAAYRAWAGAALAAGDTDAAARIYGRAIARHPANGVLRYELGALYAGAERWREAYTALNDAYTLDPWGPAGRKDGLLDLARAKVEGRA
jgi:hypothetical protein